MQILFTSYFYVQVDGENECAVIFMFTSLKLQVSFI